MNISLFSFVKLVKFLTLPKLQGNKTNMREATFLKRNAKKWEEYESLLKSRTTTPDKLAELFVEVTDDLSYAQTNYPRSRVTAYLNDTAIKIHQLIYKNKKEKNNRFLNFWKYELPLIMKSILKKELLYSFSVFMVAVLIGIVSTLYDADFIRLIIGDGYVNYTLENIKEGKPMGIYGEEEESSMFLRITLNNVMVSFRVFVFGGFLGGYIPLCLFLSGGTAYLLLYNGVMLGSFHTFFYHHDLLMTSLITVWIHGTLEISAIIIAGAAGFVMGNSIIFPKTYSRVASFKKGAKRGLKIIIGLVPVFITAGFIEGFITRYTGMPAFIKLLIILSSASFIIYYFVIYPFRVKVPENIKH